jgi:protein-tyrosine phosphatase
VTEDRFQAVREFAVAVHGVTYRKLRRVNRSADLNGAQPGIAGAGNFRSLGGLPTRDGRRIRAHFLMRSDRLCHLTPEGWEQLVATGLTTICDLRSREECAQHPNCVPAGLPIDEVACEVRNELRGEQSLVRMLIERPDALGAEALMIEIYRRLPQQMAPVLTRIGERLLRGGAPLLIHCTAGKDRTGFAVAMLLHALGVPQDEIERDYLASRTWLYAPLHRVQIAKGLATTVPPEAVDAVIDPMLDVREVYLRASFETVTKDFGSLERYLDIAVGLDSDKRAQLREIALI